MASTDLFDAYFKRADLDGDGQISGAEAVAFFQGSGLPKQVLAQVSFLSLNFTVETVLNFEVYGSVCLIIFGRNQFMAFFGVSNS